MLVLSLALAACFESHDGQQGRVRPDDCSTCHKPEYEATRCAPSLTRPRHGAIPDDLRDCHRDHGLAAARSVGSTRRWSIRKHRLPDQLGPARHHQVPRRATHPRVHRRHRQARRQHRLHPVPPRHPDRSRQPRRRDGTLPSGRVTYAYVANLAELLPDLPPDGPRDKHPEDKFPICRRPQRAHATSATTARRRRRQTPGGQEHQVHDSAVPPDRRAWTPQHREVRPVLQQTTRPPLGRYQQLLPRRAIPRHRRRAEIDDDVPGAARPLRRGRHPVHPVDPARGAQAQARVVVHEDVARARRRGRPGLAPPRDRSRRLHRLGRVRAGVPRERHPRRSPTAARG